jgi:hypothetical protein
MLPPSQPVPVVMLVCQVPLDVVPDTSDSSWDRQL